MSSKFGDGVDTGEEGTRDVQLEALAHPQRRRLLKFLLEEEPDSVPLSVAVAHLASTTHQAYQQVETVMIHRHLPKLEDAGVVTFDPHEERLTYIGDKFVTEVLDLL